MTWRGPGAVLWTWHNCDLIMSVMCASAAVIYLDFMLIPLTMAYFLTFLQAPILDLFEKRPYPLGKMQLCAGALENAALFEHDEDEEDKIRKDGNTHPAWKGREPRGGLAGEGLRLVMLGKIPHGIACLVTLVICFGGLGMTGSIVAGNFADFFAAQAELPTAEQILPGMINALNDAVNTMDDSGIKIIRPRNCSDARRALSGKAVGGKTVGIEQSYSAANGGTQTVTVKNLVKYAEQTYGNCTNENLFGGNNSACIGLCGPMKMQTMAQFTGSLNPLTVFLTDATTVVLLSIYQLLERPEGETIQGDHQVALEMEEMIKNYISLKTGLSFMTGVLVSIFLIASNVKMGIIFGLLSFLLNYIPAVGSAIATFLPIPIIMLDTALTPTQQLIGFAGPATVQLYVGNALEPQLFGASLNVTAMSVMMALTLWSFIWGMPGAVLSVPFLAASKIICYHIDHPMAKVWVQIVREDHSLP